MALKCSGSSGAAEGYGSGAMVPVPAAWFKASLFAGSSSSPHFRNRMGAFAVRSSSRPETGPSSESWSSLGCFLPLVMENGLEPLCLSRCRLVASETINLRGGSFEEDSTVTDRCEARVAIFPWVSRSILSLCSSLAWSKHPCHQSCTCVWW